MRVMAAAMFAGAASSAVAAAVSQSTSGMFNILSSQLDAAWTTSTLLDSPVSSPLVWVTLATTTIPSPSASASSDSALPPSAIWVTLASAVTPTPSTMPTGIEATLGAREASSDPAVVVLETIFAQPTSLPTPGGFKTIGCGCSYRYPNGYIECPFSGSAAPLDSCSIELVTATKQPQTTSSFTDGTKIGTGMNPTSVLSSIIAGATSWPSKVHPGMQPPLSSSADDSCVTTLKDTFSLGQRVSSMSKKAASAAMVPQFSLINGTLIDSANRIGCIVANGQLKFDLTPQAGTVYTAGWSACGPEDDRTLALGESTTLYACDNEDFSNFYYKPVDSDCVQVELAIVTSQKARPDHPRRSTAEEVQSFSELLDSDVPTGCSTNISQNPFDVHVVGIGELDEDAVGFTETPSLLLSRYSIGPRGIMKDMDGRTATFDESSKLRFQYNVSNELPWSTCEHNLLAFGDTKGFYECGSRDFPAIYSEDVGQNCFQVKLVFEDVSRSAPLPSRPHVPAAPVISVPSAPLARRSLNNFASSTTDPEFTVPSFSASLSTTLADRAAEPGFQGGFFNDEPANLNYLLTTETVTLPAQTGVDPPSNGAPESTWTLPATTIVLTESPAPTTGLNVRQEDAVASLSYWESVLASAESDLSVMETSVPVTPTFTEQAPSVSESPIPASTITPAPEISGALAMRQEHDAIWTLGQLMSTLLSAKSASEYWAWVAASYSMALHESTATFVNTACGTYDGISSCSTESLFFATQAPPANRQAGSTATATAPATVDTSIVTTSVPIATVTQVVTLNDTTCTSGTTFSVCSASSCSYVNATTVTVSYHWNGTLTAPSSTTGLPVTTNNSTSNATGQSTTTNTITTFLNGTSSTSSPNTTAPQSTTAAIGGITSEADGGKGKQVVLATVSMAIFAVLAFYL